MIDPKIFTLPWVLSWCPGLPSTSDWSVNGWSPCTPCGEWNDQSVSLNLLPDGSFDPNCFTKPPYFGIGAIAVDPNTPPDTICDGYIDLAWYKSLPLDPGLGPINVIFYGEIVFSIYPYGTSIDPGPAFPNLAITRVTYHNCIKLNSWRDNTVFLTDCVVPFDIPLPSVYDWPEINYDKAGKVDFRAPANNAIYIHVRNSYTWFGNPQ
jgi:hypothetical protein